ncbi:hypothetical protein BCE02nite_50390 [Brevibacillus centrosporus]|uniref:Uncharacterized protein n=1 Tax=Brevibacillus centrosporus TaxID=54910 RepID=A0A1I4CCW8_9BACL|nr:hypothetical protein BCE02nite_50390 [Brevibacillus centrosporus]SFK79004.1 hypothetical protein SAMN05518846_12015 [Brevibacillus centrosporus]
MSSVQEKYEEFVEYPKCPNCDSFLLKLSSTLSRCYKCNRVHFIYEY